MVGLLPGGRSHEIEWKSETPGPAYPVCSLKSAKSIRYVESEGCSTTIHGRTTNSIVLLHFTCPLRLAVPHLFRRPAKPRGHPVPTLVLRTRFASVVCQSTGRPRRQTFAKVPSVQYSVCPRFHPTSRPNHQQHSW
jgi:hypothetical protein